MKKEFWVTVVVIALLLGSVAFKLFWQKARLPVAPSSTQETLIPANPSYADIATYISAKINELSPTPSFDEIGWLAQKISFASPEPLAYVVYTDTHIVLRLLLSYDLSSSQIQTKVLATFLPVADGGWELQFGQDEASGQRLTDYIYNGDSRQWVPQELINQ